MSRKKLSPLVQAMNLFGQLDDRDKQTLDDWVKSQTATPRKAATKKEKKAQPLPVLKTLGDVGLDVA